MRTTLACTWLALALVLAACNRGSTTYTRVKSNLSLQDDSEMIAVAPGDGTVQVAVCRDGEMYGHEVVDDDMRERARFAMGRRR